MREYDAFKSLSETAALRVQGEVDPLEQTQRMPVADRRYRQFEGRTMAHPLAGLGAVYARSLAGHEKPGHWFDTNSNGYVPPGETL